MKTIELDATADEEGSLIIPPLPDFLPGKHRVVVTVEENIVQADLSANHETRNSKALSNFGQPLLRENELLPGWLVIDIPLVDANATFRREDMYDSDEY